MYNTVVVAGTFDGLHIGHEAVLARAFAEGERVIIGLTSDEYVEEFKVFTSENSLKIENRKLKISSYRQRKQELSLWLSTKGIADRATIVPIHDPYGPALTELFDALIVTSDNKARGVEINAKRKHNGLPEVALIEVPLVPAEDLKPISSSRVRAAEIDGEGHLTLPDALRPELAKPLGKILTGDSVHQSINLHQKDMIITVGDLTTKTLLDAGVIPALSIIDGRLMRKPFPDAIKLLKQKQVSIMAVKSGPGYIAKDAIAAIEQWGSQTVQTALLIEGEEDLLTLPAVVYAPVGAVLYYGQPAMNQGKEGMVEVLVTHEVKATVHMLLENFA